MKSRVLVIITLILSFFLLALKASEIEAQEIVLNLSSVYTFNYKKQVKNPKLDISIKIDSKIKEDKRPINSNNSVLMLLPFENLTGSPEIVPVVMNIVEKFLTDKKGEILLDKKAVRDFMSKYRVRHTSYLLPSVRYALYNELGIRRVLLGCIIENRSNNYPSIGLIAREIETRTGRVIWAGYYSLTGEEGFKILGIGTTTDINEVAYKVVKGLFNDYTQTSLTIMKKKPGKVAIIPFKNDTDTYGAGLIAALFYQYELFKSGEFEPVDIGETIEIMIKNNLLPLGELTNDIIDRLKSELSVDYVVVGSVIEFSNEYPGKVTVFSRSIDTRTKNLVWADFQTLNGEDNVIVLDLGLLRSIDKIMYKIVENQIKGLEKKL